MKSVSSYEVRLEDVMKESNNNSQFFEKSVNYRKELYLGLNRDFFFSIPTFSLEGNVNVSLFCICHSLRKF